MIQSYIPPNTYYHGSSSASLVGVLSDYSPGLKATGTLLSEDKVSYCGELGSGLVHINAHSLSVIPGTNIKVAVDFALEQGKIIWSVEKAIKELDHTKNDLQQAKKERDEWSKSNSTPYEYYKDQVEICTKRILIHERRLQQWSTLDERCRELIQHPFPIIYQVNYGGKVILVQSDHGGEVGIPVAIDLKDIEIYVPKDKISQVYLFEKARFVHPFKDLSPLKSYSMDNEWAINLLLQRYC